MTYGIYIHVPFCTQRCHYCDFYSLRSGIFSHPEEQFHDFAKNLIQEIELYSNDFKNNSFQSLYFGGGTPSLLPIKDFELILKAIFETFTFHKDYEFTIECNPESLSQDKIKAYKDYGVNRISMGCQTFNDQLLKDIGRETSQKEILTTYSQLREAGFDNINLDFIFALVNQSTEIYKNDLKMAVSLKPDHISAYSLILSRNLLKQKLEQGSLILPDEDSTTEQFLFTYQFLPENGLEFYEVSNYAIPGKECKHNLSYWRLEDYLGLGPSACGTLNNTRYCNTSNLKEYYHQISMKQKPIEYIESISNETKIKEKIMLSLRCWEGLNLTELEKLYKNVESDFNIFMDKLTIFIERGLLEKKHDTVRVNKKGLMVLDSILVELI